MSKVKIIKIAKKIKKAINLTAGAEFTPYVCPARRVDFVKTTERVCAMTFDDGPTKLTLQNENVSLTEALINILNKHNAKGTFDVIGTTENNYPDIEGKLSTPSWSGVKFDHYPCFNKDTMAGTENCPDIIKKIIDSGHQITNHTYSHVLYGKKNIIYSKRHHYKTYNEAKDDLLKLDRLLLDKHGYKMTFSRPPHYVDKMADGLNVYDMYSETGYGYLGASFDGAGWLPCETYEKEIDAMVLPLKKALEINPDALCGQIIFQKDGFNMALRAPVVDGLDKQLNLLDKYGYKVITVNELIERFPFSDVGNNDEDFELFKNVSKKYNIVYTDNTVRPDKIMTRGELAMMICPKNIAVNERISLILNKKKKVGICPTKHPYSTAYNYMIEKGYFSANDGFLPNAHVTFADLKLLKNTFDTTKLSKDKLTRRNVFKSIK